VVLVGLDLRRYALFLLAGGLGAGANWTLTIVLTEFAHMWYLAAFGIGVVVNIVVTFRFNDRVTFASPELLHVKLRRFVGLTILTGTVVTLGVYLLTEFASVYYLYSIVTVTLLFSVASFSISRRWVFPPARRE